MVALLMQSIPCELLRGLGREKSLPLHMVVALHRVGCLGPTRGQSISSIEERIVGGYTVRLPLGHEGHSAGHRNKDFLGVDGSVLPHGHQQVPNIVPNLVLVVIHVCCT